MSFQVGDQVGDYTIVGSVGSGGAGQVFKVEHKITGRVEAMKVLLEGRAASAAPAERFQREIKVQAKLDHPNIASVHNAFWAFDQLVMVMELVEGRSLDKVILDGPLKPGVALRYALQCLRALEYAHAQGITHRDIKPENIMVTPAGRVKLMDFGLAKDRADTKLTQVGAVVGSLYYISPEQARGRAFDHRTDIYSFGSVLYEMITGRRPFRYDSSYALLQAAVNETPPPAISIAGGIPTSLDGVIVKAMSKDPDQRFATARDLRLALEAVIRNPSAVAAGIDPKKISGVREVLTASQRAARLRRLVFVSCGLLAVLYLALSSLSKTSEADGGRPVIAAGIGVVQPNLAAQTPYDALLTLALGTPAEALAFSADGGLIAAAGADSDIRLIDVVAGKVEATLHAAEGHVVDLEFSPDGRYIASAGVDNSAELWDARAHSGLRSLSHIKQVTSVAFSRDSRFLATGSADESIRVWDLNSPGESAVLAGPAGGPTALAFSPIASMLAGVSAAPQVRLWAMRPNEGESLAGRAAGAAAVSFGANGLQLAVAGAGRVTVWDMPTRSVAKQADIPGALYALEQTDNGVWSALAVDAAEPNIARVWNVSSGELVVELPHSSPVRSVAVGALGRLFATVSEGGTLTVWKPASGS